MNRVIIVTDSGTYPHLVEREDGIYLVTPPTLTPTQQVGLLLALEERQQDGPNVVGLEELRHEVLEMPVAYS